MILSTINCLNKILSLIIIYQKSEKIKDKRKEKENQSDINKYINIPFVNEFYHALIENKDIP